MTIFVRAANPIWYMVDHTGLPLNDEYYAFFLQNTFPYLPQPPYRDPNGATVWTGGIVEFQPSGTLPNNLYFDPNLVYRIEIRHGNTQDDELIWEINNFVPGNGGGGGSTTIGIETVNQVSNPQFAFINFSSPMTITAAGSYNIAPGWTLVMEGTGTATVSRIINLSGSDDVVTNPPFALRFNFTAGAWTRAYLYQRFSENGSIWSSTTNEPNSGVTMSVTAASNNTVQWPIKLTYAPNSPGVSYDVANGNAELATYSVIAGAVPLPLSVNTTANPDAYVDMIVELPPTGDVSITSLQAIGEITDEVVTLPYEQNTVERQLDQLFHYYAEPLIVYPKKSILTGWNFPLNPYQFISPVIPLTGLAAKTQYIADQTILHQNTVSSVTTGRVDVVQGEGLYVGAVPGGAITTTKFALIQYIDPKTIMPYWRNVVSSFVRAGLFTSHGTSIKIKMRLIYRETLPGTLSDVDPILSWSGDDPVFSAGWTEIEPLNDPDYNLDTVYTDDGYPGYSFDQFQLPPCSLTTMTLGVVIYTVGDLQPHASTPDYIVFDRISLVPGKFGSDAEPQTYDQVLRECQFFYQKTFNQGDIPAQNIGNGLGCLSYRITAAGVNSGGAYWQFYQTMRKEPVLTGYNPQAANDKWRNETAPPTDSASPIFSNISTHSAYVTNPQVAGDALTNFIDIHLTAAARIGISGET